MAVVDWMYLIALIAVVIIVSTKPAVERHRKRMIERARPVRPYYDDFSHGKNE